MDILFQLLITCEFLLVLILIIVLTLHCVIDGFNSLMNLFKQKFSGSEEKE